MKERKVRVGRHYISLSKDKTKKKLPKNLLNFSQM